MITGMEETKGVKTVTLRKIGQGVCGTVWATSTGPAYKREDGGPAPSLRNDFDMHQRILQSLKRQPSYAIESKYPPAIIPSSQPTRHGGKSINQQKFPPVYTPCNNILSQRIPPFPETTRRLLISNYCPPKMAQQILNSEPDKDCLIRPYLGRRRTQKPHTTS